MHQVRKAVIPVAGLGTRFLPATKSVPKEMLTIVDRPVVQYAVDEAIEAGIEHIVFVTGRNKSAIEDYFDIQPELNLSLERAGKTAQLDQLASLQLPAGSISQVRQQSPEGLGHAIWCARHVVGDEPFAVLLPDMVSFGPRGCLLDVVDLFRRVGGNVVAVEECDPSQTHKYGIVGKGAPVENGFEITGMVEKPQPQDAPSTSYINGRYVLQPEIFRLLGLRQRGAGNEIQLTDAMRLLMATQTFYAAPFSGRMYDCGSREGFVQANVAFALARNDVRDDILDPIAELVAEHEIRRSAA